MLLHLVFIIAGTKEEKKHQIYKGGVKSTNPVNSEKQLVNRDIITSTLRYLTHGGGVGPNDQVIMDEHLSRFTDPRNHAAPHPLLNNLTKYMPNTVFYCYPRKFSYTNRRRDFVTLSPADQDAMKQLLGRQVNSTALPSKQFVVDQKVFSINDVVSVVAGEVVKKGKRNSGKGTSSGVQYRYWSCFYLSFESVVDFPR